MKTFFYLILLFFYIHPMQAQQDTLFYIGDPMCSWCYGFSSQLDEVKENLPENVQLQLIMGGLRANGTQKMPELKDFLRKHWEEIWRIDRTTFSI